MHHFLVVVTLLSLILASGAQTTSQPVSVESTGRAPAGIDQELEVIRIALERKYKDKLKDLAYRLSYNPLLYLSNGMMRLGTPLTSLGSEYIREHEVLHRVSFKLEEKEMDCYGMVREVRGQPGVYFVNIGTCNQGVSEFLDWKSEFSTYVNLK